MKTVNSISGGKTSSYIAATEKADYNIFSLVCINDNASRIKDAQMNKYINDKLARHTAQYGEFVATAEDDKTLYAVRDLEQIIGKEITWVRGKDFDDVLIEKNTHGGCLSRLPTKQFRVCTDEMKLLPIFLYCYLYIGEKVKMNIGFRFDEFDRIEKFFNKYPNDFKIPTSCKNYGNKMQVHEKINWRTCAFPLAKNGITEPMILEYWKNNGFIGGDIFEPRRQIEFPVVSNCVGCFWKKDETLAVMAELHPSKMEWFASKEEIGKGTWKKDSNYRNIIDNRFDIAKEAMFEIITVGESCDSAGCHD